MKAGIIGGGGYTAGELIRILSFHPTVELEFVYSESQAGKYVYEVHTDLLYLDMKFSDSVGQADIIFLCQGHGKAKAFLENHQVSADTIIIDLGNDFRLGKEDWVYGLPELNRTQTKNSNRIANPGCFATAIQLSILPLASSGLLKDDIHVSAITGSTGAGQKLQRTTHFTWRQNNMSVYKAFSHQHEGEIYQSLAHLQSGYNGKIRFLPHRGDFTRGIYASAYTKSVLSIEEALTLYRSYYKTHPFTIVTTENIDLKRVINTNYCYIQIEKHDDVILVHSVIDNLVKGASGQAVHNMNIRLNLEETTGLQLKPLGY